MLVNGIQLGNIWIGVQPALGVEGDPMRMLFERDLTPCAPLSIGHLQMLLQQSCCMSILTSLRDVNFVSCRRVEVLLCRHPQYAAFYKWLEQGFGADAVLHFGMHGTVEWVRFLQSPDVPLLR